MDGERDLGRRTRRDLRSENGHVLKLRDQVDHRAQGRARADPAKWVAAHGDALFRFAMLRLRERDAAQEVVQECFVAALGSRDRYSGESSERTWLIAILRHKILDRIRGQQHERHGPQAEPEFEFFDERGLWKQGPQRWRREPDAAIQQKELSRILNACLEKLPRNLSDVFLLREMDQMDSREICTVLRISPSNLWQRLHRARLALQRCMELNWFGPSKGRSVTP